MEYDDARVLITDMKIETIKDMIPILEQVSRIQKPLVIIAEDVTGRFLRVLTVIQTLWYCRHDPCLHCCILALKI